MPTQRLGLKERKSGFRPFEKLKMLHTTSRAAKRALSPFRYLCSMTGSQSSQQPQLAGVDLSRVYFAPLRACSATKKINYGPKYFEEFKRDAVRIALTSGLTHRQEKIMGRVKSSSALAVTPYPRDPTARPEPMPTQFGRISHAN
jgi:hypothetical protein